MLIYILKCMYITKEIIKIFHLDFRYKLYLKILYIFYILYKKVYIYAIATGIKYWQICTSGHNFAEKPLNILWKMCVSIKEYCILDIITVNRQQVPIVTTYPI